MLIFLTNFVLLSVLSFSSSFFCSFCYFSFSPCFTSGFLGSPPLVCLLLHLLCVVTVLTITILPSTSPTAPSSTWHITRFYFIDCQTPIYSPLIHNKQPLASDVRRWTAMTWSNAVECFYTIEYEAEPLTISLGTKRAPRGVSGTAPRGVAHQGERSMYCRYWYNKKYAVSSVLFCRPLVVIWQFHFGSTRKWKGLQNLYLRFKCDQV